MRLRRILPALVLASLAAVAACSSETTAPTDNGPTTGPLGSRSDLPIDETIRIDHLSAPVDIVRDKYGRPHLYAATVADAMRVEGYLVARDRHLELEFFRRISEGRLSEILADSDKSTIDLDIAYRHIGLGRVAKEEYDALPDGELKQVLDAYADGITQAFSQIRDKKVKLPNGIFAIEPSAFTDWSGVDSLAIGRLETQLLSYDADLDVADELFFDAARSTFTANDPDPLIAARAGLERDLFRFAPADPATTTTGYPTMQTKSAKLPGLGAGHPKAPVPDYRALVRGYVAAMQHSRSMLNPDGFGSNNWAIAPSKSTTGHPLVASDPHLQLPAPSIFWPVSIHVDTKDPKTSLDVGGIAFPGIPGIILGHNAHIAWGATVAGYDVSDVYSEQLTADGKSVMYQGKPVALKTIDEVIDVQSKGPYTYHVQVVPHHGPILPDILPNHTVAPLDPKKGALSVRWTGLEPTNEIAAIVSLMRAKDVDEARAALKDFGVGAQNWMIGDDSGNILWTSHANVPIRDTRAFQWDASTYQGTLPCLVLPGDGTAEWKGYLPDDMVPWSKNPASGYLSTANNDPIGNTLDNDPSNDTLPDGTPMYLHCTFDIGFREGRIQKRIEEHQGKLSPADLASIQADTRSPMGAALAPLVIQAIDLAEEERKTPGTHPDLTGVVNDPGYSATKIAAVRDLLDAWGKDSDYDAASGIDPETNEPLPASGDTAKDARAAAATLVFDTWLVRVVGRTFADESLKMNSRLPDREHAAKAILHLMLADPTTLATYDPATKDSSIWDDLTTPEVESRHEVIIRSLLDALGDLSKLAGEDVSTYRWGAYHTVTFTALVPVFGKLSIPPAGDPTFPKGFPRHGDSFNVDASDFGYVAPGQTPNFTYAHGPTQRFVADLDPAGPKVENALPGGVIWDSTSPHFRDEAEYWRKNQTHPIPFLLTDVVAAKETRTVATP